MGVGERGDGVPEDPSLLAAEPAACRDGRDDASRPPRPPAAQVYTAARAQQAARHGLSLPQGGSDARAGKGVHAATTVATRGAGRDRPAIGARKLPRYRWHLGCIPLKMPAISLLTGALQWHRGAAPACAALRGWRGADLHSSREPHQRQLVAARQTRLRQRLHRPQQVHAPYWCERRSAAQAGSIVLAGGRCGRGADARNLNLRRRHHRVSTLARRWVTCN